MCEPDCPHPTIEVEMVLRLDPHAPTFAARCLTCGQVSIELLRVTYSDHYVLHGDRLLRAVLDRGDLAVCAACGRLMFPEFGQVPVMLFLGVATDAEPDAELDLCPECNRVLSLVG